MTCRLLPSILQIICKERREIFREVNFAEFLTPVSRNFAPKVLHTVKESLETIGIGRTFSRFFAHRQ